MDFVPHILVVDDDERLRHLLRQFLRDRGWMVTAASDAKDARRKMATFVFDLIVLDVMMPGETGVAFARALSKKPHPPILMLTAMSEVEDRIEGLEAGADDYLGKPFEPRELALRIEKILQRRAQETAEANAVRFGDYAFDAAQHTLQRNGAPVYLTGSESDLLGVLAKHAGTPVTRDALAAALKLDTDNERSVDVQITRLRKKIEPEPSRPVYIQTVRGEGYVLRVAGNA